ncbi:MAG: sulfatase-like hydrolase/transferase, partial [Planctomycetes bacterium]|nr:sulfatase-like hydrolase/transferase [Planctomycetota bacterium]
IIVVVADHGQGLGDHDWWYHRVLYQEQIRIPLLIRMPGGPGGVRVDSLVRTIDIFPTILDALKLPIPERMDGKSLLGLMEGRPEPPRFAYADAINLLDNNVGDVLQNSFRDLMYCVMDRSWKLIYHEFRPELNELYHLEEDPFEKNNVMQQYPEQYKKMMKLLDQTGGKIQEIIEAAPENKEALERLKELGYGN